MVNTGPHRPANQAAVERGVFRKYRRKDGSDGAVLYFNTNKTADVDDTTKGYVMPWEKADALQIFVTMRNWQERFNAVAGPTIWSDIQELKPIKHEADLAVSCSNCHYAPVPMVRVVRLPS